MLKIVVVLALSLYQTSASNLQVVPGAPLVTARSSQYFSQNYNAPLVAQYVVAPSSSASVSQVTRYAQYVASPAVAQYFAPAAVTHQYVGVAPPPVAQYVVAPAQYVAAPAPVAKSAVPLVARPIVVARGSPIAPVAPQQQQPSAFQAPNPDSEAVEVESARVRALPQARNQGADQPRQPEIRRFQGLPPQDQQQVIRVQSANNNPQLVQRSPQVQEQQRAAQDLLRSQQFVQGPYLA